MEQVCGWYEHRACEIEHLSGQVDGALELVKLAIDKSVEVCHNCVFYFVIGCQSARVGL